MKIILAISGGVDSMVMLDMARKMEGLTKEDLIVAHFDHGIRENSGEDAEFVRRKAGEYGLECRIQRGSLGPGAAEAEARKARYAFLETVRRAIYEQSGEESEIWTAHHLDDLVESVAINFIRGTGWRGLAVLDSKGVRRPFLDRKIVDQPMDKAAIFRYAGVHGVEFREDQSNSWDEYLRNRVRHQMNNSGRLSSDKKLRIYELWRQQRQLKAGIDALVNMVIPSEDEEWRRKWFEGLEKDIALELLKRGTGRKGIEATRPQLEDFRQAILCYGSGKYFNLPGDKLVKLKKETFEI